MVGLPTVVAAAAYLAPVVGVLAHGAADGYPGRSRTSGHSS
jgi:hypothetical protein